METRLLFCWRDARAWHGARLARSPEMNKLSIYCGNVSKVHIITSKRDAREGERERDGRRIE